MQTNLEAVHEAAKLCVRHCLSLNRTADVVGRTFVQFDQDELRLAVDEGHRQIKPIIGHLMQHAVATSLADGDRTVVAKCAHGLALQVAVRTLALLADGVPEAKIRWGMDPLLNLYGMLGTEFHAAATPPVAEPSTTPEDGPGEPGVFYSRGVRYELTAVPWRIVARLWDAHPAGVELHALADEWRDYEPERSAIDSALSRARSGLAGSGIGIATQAGVVRLDKP